MGILVFLKNFFYLNEFAAVIEINFDLFSEFYFILLGFLKYLNDSIFKIIRAFLEDLKLMLYCDFWYHLPIIHQHLHISFEN